MKTKTSKTPVTKSPAFKWAVPEGLNIPREQLQVRLNIYSGSVELEEFDGDKVTTRMVSAIDIAHALSRTLTYGTGLLAPDTLWWRNTREGVVTAIYDPPGVRKIALQRDAVKAVTRYAVPLPGFIFLCSPGKAPWVYAVTQRPASVKDTVYRAPLTNIHDNGFSCGGTNKYPQLPRDIVASFWMSFFAAHLTSGRAAKHKDDITKLWKKLDGKKVFPADELVAHGTVQDLMTMEMGEDRLG